MLTMEKPKTKPVSIRLPEPLLDQVEEYRADQEFPPSLSAIIEKALRDFLAAKRGGKKK